MNVQSDIIKIKENRKHGTALVPFSLYECPMPELFTHVLTHWHEEFELNYVWEGEGEIYLNGEKYTVSVGDILVILPNVLHAAYPRRGSSLKYDAFVFHPSLLGIGNNDRSAVECVYPLLKGQMKINCYITKEREDYQEFLDCIRQILSAARENKGHSDLLLKSGLFRFLYLLEKGASLNPEAESFERDLIRPSLRYMEEHYGENVTICQLAGCCNLSKSYFMSCFKKATGISAMEHLIQLRIRAACEALHKTDRNISDIAANCGYSNLSNFNRQFKRYVGCSPGNYRRMGKNHQNLLHNGLSKRKSGK